MKPAWQLTLAASAAAALSVSVWAQGTDFSKIEFTTKQIAPNLYMISGSPNVDVNHPDAAGGLVGVLAGSDGIYCGGYPHPRGWGAFARYLGYHTRTLGDYSWPEAITHLATHAARRYRLTDRGLVRPS